MMRHGVKGYVGWSTAERCCSVELCVIDHFQGKQHKLHVFVSK